MDLLERTAAMEAEIEYDGPRSNIHPAAESLAGVQIARGEAEAAREALQSVLLQRPKAGMPLFSIARNHEVEGNTTEAKKAYRAFLAAWQSPDDDRPQKQHAQAWLASH